MAYRGRKEQLREIAAELEVGTVLEGTVRRAGNPVRLTAESMHAPTDKHLWAHTAAASGALAGAYIQPMYRHGAGSKRRQGNSLDAMTWCRTWS